VCHLFVPVVTLVVVGLEFCQILLMNSTLLLLRLVPRRGKQNDYGLFAADIMDLWDLI